MNLELLKRFYITAQEGHLTKAAYKMNVAQSALTRSIHQFEYQLKTPLFDRTKKRITLTPQGERLYAFAKKIIEETATFEKIFYEKEYEIAGEIKIITTPFVGIEWLVPSLKEFLHDHPNIKIKILLKSENITVAEGDVAICTAIPHQSHIIQKLLFNKTICLFASKSYLEKNGIPRTPADLDYHRLITYKGNYCSMYGSTDWLINLENYNKDHPRESCFQINSLYGMFKSALAGYGIVELPNYSSVLESGLQEVLPQYKGKEIPLYYSFSENRRESKKINLLFDYLSKISK